MKNKFDGLNILPLHKIKKDYFKRKIISIMIIRRSLIFNSCSFEYKLDRIINSKLRSFTELNLIRHADRKIEVQFE